MSRIDYHKEFPPDKIRKRISYNFYLTLAQDLQKKGVSSEALDYILSYVYSIKCGWGIYKYGSNKHWAQQSINLLKQDLKLKK